MVLTLLLCECERVRAVLLKIFLFNTTNDWVINSALFVTSIWEQWIRIKPIYVILWTKCGSLLLIKKCQTVTGRLKFFLLEWEESNWREVRYYHIPEMPSKIVTATLINKRIF